MLFLLLFPGALEKVPSAPIGYRIGSSQCFPMSAALRPPSTSVPCTFPISRLPFTPMNGGDEASWYDLVRHCLSIDSDQSGMSVQYTQTFYTILYVLICYMSRGTGLYDNTATRTVPTMLPQSNVLMQPCSLRQTDKRQPALSSTEHSLKQPL